MTNQIYRTYLFEGKEGIIATSLPLSRENYIFRVIVDCWKKMRYDFEVTNHRSLLPNLFHVQFG